jgi:hypothetical protein
MKFDIVLSGVSYLSQASKRMLEEPYGDIMRGIYSSLNGKHNHHVSILYNSFAEKNQGPLFEEVFKNQDQRIYADSGGLQMITLGKEIDAEAKKSIYQNQADFSDFAMSFDEIPVVTTGKSGIGDVSNRFFDRAGIESKARQTGRNLKDQIAYFDAQNTKSKPMLILQGNSLESTQLWLDCVCDELGSENFHMISGVASALSSMGSGTLEDFERAFIVNHLKYPEGINYKHMHLLGIGSLTKLVPIVLLARDNDMMISYDSTKITGNFQRGCYYYKGDFRYTRVGNTGSKKFDKFYDDIVQNLDELSLNTMKENFDYDIFFKKFINGKEWTSEGLGAEDRLRDFNLASAYLIAQTHNFIADLAKVCYDDNHMENFYGVYPYFRAPCIAFAEVRDEQDMIDWRTMHNMHWKKRIKSKALKELEQTGATLV